MDLILVMTGQEKGFLAAIKLQMDLILVTQKAEIQTHVCGVHESRRA